MSQTCQRAWKQCKNQSQLVQVLASSMGYTCSGGTAFANQSFVAPSHVTTGFYHCKRLSVKKVVATSTAAVVDRRTGSRWLTYCGSWGRVCHKHSLGPQFLQSCAKSKNAKLITRTSSRRHQSSLPRASYGSFVRRASRRRAQGPISHPYAQAYIIRKTLQRLAILPAPHVDCSKSGGQHVATTTHQFNYIFHRTGL